MPSGNCPALALQCKHSKGCSALSSEALKILRVSACCTLSLLPFPMAQPCAPHSCLLPLLCQQAAPSAENTPDHPVVPTQGSACSGSADTASSGADCPHCIPAAPCGSQTQPFLCGFMQFKVPEMIGGFFLQ